MKRKPVFITLVVLCLAVPVCAWLGLFDDYSEQQRKLWNEERALFPLLWKELDEHFFWTDTDDVSQTITDEERAQEKAKLEKIQKGKLLTARRTQLRDRENLPVPFFPAKSLSLDLLRSDELSLRECLERARGGDGDACLEMALHLGEREAYLMSQRRAGEVEYWLDQAIAARRPGALFMKHFFRKAHQRNQKGSILSNGYIVILGTHYLEYSSCPGYDEFLQCMEDGDLTAYRVIHELTPRYVCPGRDKLRKALLGRAQAGNVRAMENMCSLFFETPVDRWKRLITYELESQVSHNTLLQKLSPCIRNDVRFWMERVGILSVEKTEGMREFREAEAFALAAAREGSLAGMYFALRFDMRRRLRLEKEQWEELLHFQNVLLSNEYMPFTRCLMSSYVRQQVEMEPMSLDIYYSEQSVQKAKASLMARAKSRGELPNHMDDLLSEKDAASVRKFLDERMALFGSDSVMEELSTNMKLWNVSEEIKGVYVDKIQEMCEAGDPHALFVQGFLYHQGRGIQQDLGKAWACYSQAWENLQEGDFFFINYPDPMIEGGRGSDYIQNAIRTFMISMVVKHLRFPGRDEAKAYEMAQGLQEFAERNQRDSLNYLLGRVYEDGIGTPPDKEKALEYYMRGSEEYPACAEGCERLEKSFIRHHGR